MEYISRSEQETLELAKKCAACLERGEVVALRGGLGAGKTAFVKGLAAGLGIEQEVVSPTFTIMNEYRGAVPIYHFDLYRLSGPDDLFDVGLDEHIGGDGITAVEWSELLGELCRSFYVVSIEVVSQNERKITILKPNEGQGNEY